MVVPNHGVGTIVVARGELGTLLLEDSHRLDVPGHVAPGRNWSTSRFGYQECNIWFRGTGQSG